MLRPNLSDRCVRPTEVKWEAVEGKQLQYPEGCDPFKRLLVWHAKVAYDIALSNGWITKEQYDAHETLHELSVGALYPRDGSDCYAFDA